MGIIPPDATREPESGMAAGGQRLSASLVLAPACRRLPLAWSRRPCERRRRLPVARPTAFLTAPLTASALCAIFLEILMREGLPFRRVIRPARVRRGRRRRTAPAPIPAGELLPAGELAPTAGRPGVRGGG